MTSSPSSQSNFVFGSELSLEDMELSRQLMDFDPLFCFEVGKTHGIVPFDIRQIFETSYNKYMKDSLPNVTSYKELGDQRGAIARYGNSMIVHMDSVQRGDSGGYITVTIYGSDRANLQIVGAVLKSALSEHIRDEWDEIEWMSKAGGGSINESTFPIKKYDPIMPEVYPFIPDVVAWVDRYLKSKSNVLILNGPMGTGKSSLIAYIIRRGKMRSMTAFDEKIMKEDYLYTKFISENYSLLVLEDADRLLFERVTGENDTMSKLLNVSEGIIDTSNKRIIFTANLGNTTAIDPALTRPGRCFDVVEFRDLSFAEANVARVKLGRKEFPSIVDGGKLRYTLAEVYQ